MGLEVLLQWNMERLGSSSGDFVVAGEAGKLRCSLLDFVLGLVFSVSIGAEVYSLIVFFSVLNIFNVLGSERLAV